MYRHALPHLDRFDKRDVHHCLLALCLQKDGAGVAGLIGAILAHFRVQGMTRAVFAMALARALVAAIALLLGLGAPWSLPAESVMLNGVFVALFGASALLFRYAAREPGSAGAWPEA